MRRSATSWTKWAWERLSPLEAVRPSISHPASPRLTHVPAGIEYFVAAAIAFYKALLVYPAPAELLGIYEKTQPPAVYSLVMELVHLE
jgi:hypothetical protein